MKIRKYKHKNEVSYALGATLVYELLNCQPESITRVFINTKTEQTESIKRLVEKIRLNNILIEQSDKAFNILSPKENCFVIAEFRKTKKVLENGSHIVLVNPSDAGNLGTIIRTAIGFGINNIAIIKPAVDHYDPRTIRASMGAIFHSNIEYFNSIEEYIQRFPKNIRYAFMLTAKASLSKIDINEPFSLIFGNEATGLSNNYHDICLDVRIFHSSNIDSLSLPMAAGIAMYEFTKELWK